MFLGDIKKNIFYLEKAVYSRTDENGEFLPSLNQRIGALTIDYGDLKYRLNALENENKKLKAIVAELCNYIYDEERKK